MASSVAFPLKVQFENGEIEEYKDIEDLELNLEDFDSDLDTDCQVRDALGRTIYLKIKLLRLQELRIAELKD